MEKVHGVNAPLVSVCMPAYNAGRYILEAVNSVINQTYEHWELIIINDGSTDHTSQVLEQITDSRVQIHQQQNKGKSITANRACNLSKGTLIKFMDADDLLSAQHLELQVNALAGRDDTIAYASWGRFYKDDPATFRPEENLITADLKPLDWLIKSMTGKEVMLQCAMFLIPKPILDKAGLWNEKLSLLDDFEFFIRVLLKAGQLKHTQDAILYYRSGLRHSLSSLTDHQGAVSGYNSINWGTGHLLNIDRSDAVKKVAADCFQRFVFNFYPHHRHLTEKAEFRIKELGGSAIRFSAGGYTKLLVTMFGWKMTKKIKSVLKKIS